MGEPERLRRQLGEVTRALLVLVGLLPWLLPFAHHHLPGEALWKLLDRGCEGACHRLPARTLTLASLPMPLCSRCAGICAGLALGALLRWPRLTASRARLALGAAGVVMLADVVAQDLAWHPLWHWSRLGTGGLVGYLTATVIVTALVGEAAAGATARTE